MTTPTPATLSAERLDEIRREHDALGRRTSATYDCNEMARVHHNCGALLAEVDRLRSALATAEAERLTLAAECFTCGGPSMTAYELARRIVKDAASQPAGADGGEEGR